MTSIPPDHHDELFVADFYPELGGYLADKHATGNDAALARTRFILWLAAHLDPADDPLKTKNDGPAER